MHDRHTNRERYFNEQVFTTQHFVIPYIQRVKPILADHVVVEIGCGEGGNLKPFLDLGCRVMGIDLSKTKIENARTYLSSHQNADKLTLVAEDVYKVDPSTLPLFDVVILRDTIEHIPNQEVFMQKLRDYLSPTGVVFFAFPPWRMPFGGHQQVCKNKIASILPYYHLLPMPLYKWVLKLFGESPLTVEGLVEIKETGISTRRFHKILKNTGFTVLRSTNYLINPNYEIKFKLKTRVLPGFLNIPYFRDFLTTAHYCVVSKKN